MKLSDKFTYPAVIKRDRKGKFLIYFPTLFPDTGWEYPLTKGDSKETALKNAEKELALSLAGFIYDNEEIPAPVPILKKQLSEGMELIEIETSMASYADEIEEHLQGRHWHIGYYKRGHIIEAIGFKNDEGLWDIFYDKYLAKRLSEDDQFKPIFTVKTYSEAEEKFEQYVENVLLKEN